MSAFNSDSSLMYSKDDYRIPLSHTGYLKKRGQRIKTWKRRYVAVELGRLTYFEKSNGTDEPPYGLGLKGSLTLNGYEVEDGPKKTMLMLLHKTEKRELLVEAENGEAEADNWRALFEHHIQFCNENPNLFLHVGASFQEDEAKRAAVATKFRESGRVSNLRPFSDNNELEDEEDGDNRQVSSFSAPVPIQLNPGFVIKSKRVGGMKVFINVCDHDSIPTTDKKRGKNRWPIFVLSPSFKISVDKNAEECHVLDVCVHPSVMEECQEDSTGEAKDEICLKIMEAIIAREKKDKVECLIDKTVFSFPRLTKKYKGDVVATFLIPRNIQAASKTTSVFTAIDINEHVNQEELEEEQPPVDLDADPFAPRESSKVKEKATGSSKSGAVRKNSVFFNSGIPKKFITVNAERKTGAVIRERPAKSSSRIKTLPQNSKTYCYGSQKIGGVYWYRVLEGWTTACTDGGQRMLKPVCAEQPITSIIRGVNLVEKEEKGFIFSSTIQKLTFSVQLSFPREALLRLQRSYDDFLDLRDGLKDENVQTTKAFPEYGIEELRNGTEVGVDLLLDIMEDLDQWLKCTLEEVSFDSGPSIRKFLQATEADCKKIDADLSADGGLDGAWPIDFK